MDEEITTTIDTQRDDFVDEYIEALDTIPEEVRQFLWSEAFTLILKAIGETYRLTEEQQKAVRRVVMGIVTDTSTPISRQIELSDAGITGDLQNKVLQAINDEILSRMAAQMEFEDGLLDQENTNTSTEIAKTQNVSAPSPLEALAMIKDRLAKPGSITPTKRDYSDTLTTTPNTPPATSIKSIDPYRELPEK
jgi:hypothetical protein